jgi:hypothetical protein
LSAGSTYLSEFLNGIRSAGDIEIAVGKKQGALQPLSAAQIGKIASRWTGKKFANGGVVKAPTIAMVGDNRNAHRDPEIISPQSAIQKALAGAQPQPSGKTERLLEQLIGILNEFFTEYSNADHSVVISEKEIFNATRNQNTKYKNAHGRSALV